MAQGWAGLLRRRGEEPAPVTSMELFFDLVYVLAITQLTNYPLHDLNRPGAGRSLLLAVWWSWNYTAWFANYFRSRQAADPARPHRVDAGELGHVGLAAPARSSVCACRSGGGRRLRIPAQFADRGHGHRSRSGHLGQVGLEAVRAGQLKPRGAIAAPPPRVRRARGRLTTPIKNLRVDERDGSRWLRSWVSRPRPPFRLQLRPRRLAAPSRPSSRWRRPGSSPPSGAARARRAAGQRRLPPTANG